MPPSEGENFVSCERTLVATKRISPQFYLYIRPCRDASIFRRDRFQQWKGSGRTTCTSNGHPASPTTSTSTSSETHRDTCQCGRCVRTILLLRGDKGARIKEIGISFVACRSLLTIVHASLSRPSIVSAPNRITSNIWTLITCFPYIT